MSGQGVRIEGEILAVTIRRTLSSEVADLTIQTGREIVDASMWGEILETCREKIKAGAKLCFIGSYRGDLFWISKVRSIFKRSEQPRLIGFKEIEDRELALGRVAVRDSVDGRIIVNFISQEYAINVNGKWHRKIDYVMDRLGPAEVTKRLRDAGIGWKQGSPKYKELLDEMVSEAKALAEW